MVLCLPDDFYNHVSTALFEGKDDMFVLTLASHSVIRLATTRRGTGQNAWGVSASLKVAR